LGGQRWRCTDCRRRFTVRSSSAFSHHGFPDDVIAVAVRWYVRYRLSYADVVAWFAERGLTIDRSTIYHWVQRFLPLFTEAARAHRRPVGEKWRVDETYIRLGGTWTYIYRAIDEDGQVVDAYFSERRNAKAGYPLGEAFFERAITATGVSPTRVTTDKAKCYPPALRTVLANVVHRCSHYLNNGIERDHGPGTLRVKQRRSPMRGFKQAASADLLACGHAFIQNLRNGFSELTATVPRRLRLMTAWSQLIQAI
jgi:transposase-like protein